MAMQRDTLSSSDEEDDTHSLVLQNEIKHAPATPRRSTFSSLHIDDDTARIHRRFTNLQHSMFNKRHIISFCLPLLLLLLLVLFFTTDMRNLFSPNFSSFTFKLNSDSENMRESELRALYLLRQQQLGLLGMWNYTLGVDSLNNSTSGLNSSTVDHLLSKLNSLRSSEDLKSVVLKQISLNKEIQQVLLSTHQTGESSELGFRDGKGSTVGLGYGRCSKKDLNFSQRKTIEWKPNPDKFLFAICLSGQMSNHLICLEKHMFFAAVLNRVLVIPSPKFDYQYHKVLDIDHINKCLGRKVVATFEEFEEMRKKRLHINKFLCYFSLPRLCYVDDDHLKKLKALGISMGKLEAAWDEDISKPKKKTIQDIQIKFSSDEDVIAIGDVFFADAEQEWTMQPGGPLAHKCKTLIEPSRVIFLTAQRFIQTFLGKNFIALHFRRHGFLKFCNVKNPSCFYAIPQAADCITRIVERANAPVIYLSTDAAESETDLLQSLLMLNGKSVPLVKRPSRNWAEKWDALLYRNKLEGDSQVEAMLDKTICAMSEVFIGASGSTFTEDILRLRKDWGSASVCDEYLCQGELPNFIAENE